MKSFKKILIYLIIVIILFVILYKWPKTTNNINTTITTINIVGGDRDEHGCIGSAGYSWCESKQKCLRVWEESCQDTNPTW